MSFHSVGTPPGTVLNYIGGGTTTSGTNTGDPDGWVICDGQTRTVTDSRFQNLYAILNTYMAVSTNTANSITPPDLRGNFIYGQTNAATTTKSIGGANNVTLSVANLPAHNHTIPDHGHSINDPSHNHNINSNNYVPAASGGGAQHLFQEGGSFAGSPFTGNGIVLSSYTGITVNNATGLSTNNQGSGTSFSILPTYTSMNYIMKY